MLGELVWYFTGRDDVEFISKFSSFWERIAMSSDTPRPAVSEYCLDNAIVTEVNDEN